MARTGREPKYKKDFHPTDFIRRSEQGKTFAQIAGQWKIDRTTLHRWEVRYPDFRIAVIYGRELSEAWYMELGQAALIGGTVKNAKGEEKKVSLAWFQWLTKNMFKWNDRASLEHSGPDGRPIETVSKSDLNDEQLDAKIQKLLDKGK